MEKKRILILASHSGSLLLFRGDLITGLINCGFKVFTAAPDYSGEIRKKLIGMGANPIEYSLNRTGLNPISDLKSILEIRSIIKNHNIHLIFPYTVKPVIYGSIAANWSKKPVISLITGLGFTFTGLTLKARILQKLNEFLYKISIRKNKVIVFQNKDDRDLFLERKIISKKNKVETVSGSGVNLNRYPYRLNNNTSESVSFILVARLIKEKGIGLFMEAAEFLKKKYPNAEFHIIGATYNSPSGISSEKLIEMHEKEIIIFHGVQKNVPEHLYKRDVFVLPTYYREGIPRSILEALSVGLPIVTTNTPGCKETVKKDYNGILIKPRDLSDLINAMVFFLEHKEKIKEMGINSRKYAEERFDVNIINNDLIRLIKKELKILN